MRVLKTMGIILLIALIYLISLMISSAILPMGVEPNPNETSQTFPMLLLGSLLYATLLAYILKRAGSRGLALILLVSCTWYGMITFMTQIETGYFIKAFPKLSLMELGKLFIRGFISTVILVPLAVMVTGKLKPKTPNPSFNIKMIFTQKPIWVLSLVSVFYVTVYLLAGYFIAWQFDHVRLFYTGSTAKLSFGGQMLNIIIHDTPLIPFQVIRALLWFLFGMPLFMLFRERRTECIIISFLAFGLLPTIQLLYPNPLMPYMVRMAHLIETSISTGLFGAFTAWLWLKYNSQERIQSNAIEGQNAA